MDNRQYWKGQNVVNAPDGVVQQVDNRQYWKGQNVVNAPDGQIQQVDNRQYWKGQNVVNAPDATTGDQQPHVRRNTVVDGPGTVVNPNSNSQYWKGSNVVNIPKPINKGQAAADAQREADLQKQLRGRGATTVNPPQFANSDILQIAVTAEMLNSDHFVVNVANQEDTLVSDSDVGPHTVVTNIGVPVVADPMRNQQNRQYWNNKNAVYGPRFTSKNSE